MSRLCCSREDIPDLEGTYSRLPRGDREGILLSQLFYDFDAGTQIAVRPLIRTSLFGPTRHKRFDSPLYG
jgi:hypothetical protein